MMVQWYRNKSDALCDGYLHIARDVTSSGIKQFASVKTYEEISKIIDKYQCVYEIVTSSWTEMYDFDGKDLPCTEEDIISNFKYCRSMISKDVVHVKSSSTMSRISLHFIVPSVVLNNYEVMYVRYQRMMNVPELLYKECYDGSIYTRDRLIRTVRSDKCFQGRPFRSESKDCDLFVSHPYRKEFDNKMKNDNDLLMRYHLSESFRMDTCLYGNVYRLRRISPSWCIICERVHEHENASLDIDSGTYSCFRSPGKRKTLDGDRLVLNRSKLISQLKNYGLNDQEIRDIISRSA